MKLPRKGNPFDLVPRLFFQSDNPLNTGPAYVLYSCLLCLYFYLAGLPWPHVDDPFFAGAAVRLAQTGSLTNPWVMDAFPNLDQGHFYLHWPIYFYLLGVWLKFTGIHVSSICLFYAVSNIILCLASAKVLLRLGLPRPIIWVLPFFAVGYGAVLGFRPDAVALALFFAGLALWSANGKGSWFCGAFLVGVAVSMTFVLCPYAIGFGWLLVRGDLASLHSGSPFRCRIITAILAAFALALVLTWMIAADWQGFLRDYFGHVQLRRARSWNQILLPGALILVRQDPAYIIALLSLLLFGLLKLLRHRLTLPPALFHLDDLDIHPGGGNSLLQRYKGFSFLFDSLETLLGSRGMAQGRQGDAPHFCFPGAANRRGNLDRGQRPAASPYHPSLCHDSNRQTGGLR